MNHDRRSHDLWVPEIAIKDAYYLIESAFKVDDMVYDKCVHHCFIQGFHVAVFNV